MPLVQTLRSAFQKMAPNAVAHATGRPRQPMAIGLALHTVEMVSGQKLSRLQVVSNKY